jgi:hypothetical protein
MVALVGGVVQEEFSGFGARWPGTAFGFFGLTAGQSPEIRFFEKTGLRLEPKATSSDFSRTPAFHGGWNSSKEEGNTDLR